MKFVPQDDIINVFAYRGFDKKTRRATMDFMGYVDALSLTPSEGLINKLTDGEEIELRSYIRSRQHIKK